VTFNSQAAAAGAQHDTRHKSITDARAQVKTVDELYRPLSMPSGATLSL